MGDFIIEDGVLVRYAGQGGEVVIPDGVTAIDAEVFTACNALTGVTIPDSVCSIGAYAFADCENLVSVRLPASLEEIEEGVFSGCNNLRDITIPDSVYRIGDHAFANCRELTELVFSETLEIIGESAFNGCMNLKNIRFTGQLYEIGKEAFAYCHSLKDITIPAGPTIIDTYAFSFCKRLKSIHLGAMKTLCFGAFAGCKSLKEISIAAPADFHGEQIFRGCPGLADENGFVIVRGILYNYYGEDSIVTIPEGVRHISEGAFRSNERITKVNLPESLEGIGNHAFEVCKNLVDENGFTIVRGALFGYWGEKTEITIPEGVIAISSFAFYEMEDLTHIYIPASVTAIGKRALENFDDLTIHTPAGSYAAEYGEMHGLKVVEE